MLLPGPLRPVWILPVRSMTNGLIADYLSSHEKTYYVIPAEAGIHKMMADTMLNRKVRDSLDRLCSGGGGTVMFDHPLHEHSTISIGGRASAWYMPASPEELREAVVLLADSGVRTIVVGRGSNVLIPDKGLDAVVINLSADLFREITFRGRAVTAGAGAGLGELISGACAHGLTGLEGLVGIPASVGGALSVNASYRTAISERLSRALFLSAAGETKWIEKENLEFGYRRSSFDRKGIILQAVFQLDEELPARAQERLKTYFAEKIKKQPLGERSLGCVFKNPGQRKYASGELIDRVGMKGYRRGAAQVSRKHANFIINTGGATSADVIGLMDDIRDKVRKKFLIELEPEIEIL